MSERIYLLSLIVANSAYFLVVTLFIFQNILRSHELSPLNLVAEQSVIKAVRVHDPVEIFVNLTRIF